MFGLKAVNYYMLVERDRWMGSPITQDNKIRTPYFEMYRHWNAFLKRSHFHEWDLQADLLLLANYDQDRLLKALKKVESHFVHLLPEEVGFEEEQTLFSYRVEEEIPRWSDGSWSLALRNHLPLRCSDTVASIERLRGHKAVWVPTFEALEKEAQDNLRLFAEEGGTLLMGPQVPSLDGDYRPYCAFPELRSASEAKVGKGLVALVKEFDETRILSILAKAGVRPVLEDLPPKVLASQFHKDGKTMIFLANAQDNVTTFSVGQKLSPLYGTPEDRSLKPGHLTLDPWSVTVWELRP
jgi:beta-galactosidase